MMMGKRKTPTKKTQTDLFTPVSTQGGVIDAPANPTPARSPVYDVIAVPIEKIRANAYNPNAVAPPEMALLELSILEDGYTMPIVCYYIADEDVYEIVDGYHRYTTMLRNPAIRERESGVLPVSVINKDLSNRMASTIRHNRARGSHSIELMSNIVAELTRAGMSDAWILRHVGMDKDELLRLKQITGLADLFRDQEFSEAWATDADIELPDVGTDDADEAMAE
jgi:ParB-like chromosome segregation protein Spo0J